MASHTKGESRKRWEWYRFHRIILGPPLSSVKPSKRVMCVREFRCAENLKRGGGMEHVSLDEVATIGPDRRADLVMLDDALSALTRFDPRKAQVIGLRFLAA